MNKKCVNCCTFNRDLEKSTQNNLQPTNNLFTDTFYCCYFIYLFFTKIITQNDQSNQMTHCISSFS